MKNLLLLVLMFTTSFVFGSTLPEYDVGIEKTYDMTVEMPTAQADFIITKTNDVITYDIKFEKDYVVRSFDKVIYLDAITRKHDPSPDLRANTETGYIVINGIQRSTNKAKTNTIDRLMYSSGGLSYNCN